MSVTFPVSNKACSKQRKNALKTRELFLQTASGMKKAPPKRGFTWPGLALFGGDIERERVDLMEEVHVLHENGIRHGDSGGRVVEYALDAGIHKLGGGALGAFRRNSDDAYLDAESGHFIHKGLGALHFKAV